MDLGGRMGGLDGQQLRTDVICRSHLTGILSSVGMFCLAC